MLVVRIVRDHQTNELIIVLPDADHADPAEFVQVTEAVSYERFTTTGAVPGIYLANMADAVLDVVEF